MLIKSTSNTSPYVISDNPVNPYPSASTTGINTNYTWEPEEKEALVKVGFKYNKEKENWELNLIATVSLPGKDISGFINPHKTYDDVINTMKELKEKLIKKLTAKMILMELVKPRDIKE